MADDADVGAGGGQGAFGDDASPADGLPDRLAAVPLFPLPGCVLLPGAVLPLHVFERRYRQMTRHALGEEYDGRRLLGICRVRDGADPMDDQPSLHEVACVAAIVDHQSLPDGRFNLLVKGLARVKIRDELPVHPDAGDDPKGGRGCNGATMYRRADLGVVRCSSAFEIDLGEAREKMRDLCRRPPIVGTPVAHHLDKLFASGVPTARLADVLAFDLLEDVDAKQALLEETNVRRRVERLAALLDRQFPEPDSILKLSKRFSVDD